MANEIDPSPSTLNAMQYYPDGGVVIPPTASEPTPQPQPTGIEGKPQASPDLDPSDIPGAITTPQLPQAQGDQGIDPADQPGAITDPNIQSDEARYGTPGQLALAGAEQFAQGIAGPTLPAFEKYTGLSTPEAMRAREEQLHEQQPGVGETLKIAGTAASLGLGAGTLPLASTAGEALASAAGLTKASGLSAKIGAGALRGATELGLLSAGDEITKQIVEDPNTSTQTALMDIGLNSLLGAVGGGALGGVGALLSRGNASKLVQEAENFKGQFQNRIDVPDPVTAMHEEQSARYNEIKNAYDNLHGNKGLKASVIAKTVPAQLNDKIIGEAQDNLKDFSDAISDMRKKPYHYPERLVNKLEADVQEASNVMFPTDGTTQPSPAQFFTAQQDLKQMAQSYAKYDKFIKPSDDAYDFVNKIKPLAHSLRESLEDPNIWGEAGKFQQNLNKSWSNMKPAFEGYEKYFTEKVPIEDPVTGNVSLENRSSLAKLNTYANQAGTFKDSAKKAYLKAFLDQSDKFAAALDDAHEALGEESPFTYSPMNVSRQSLEELTPGMQLANAVVDQGLGKGAAHGLASSIGATGGATLGGILAGPLGAGTGATAGALIGEKALGPLFAKSLPIIGKAFFNKVAEARGLRAFGQYVYRYARGQELLSQSAKNIFKAGAEVLPVSAIPKVTHLAQLDKQLMVAQQDPTQFANNLSNSSLGSYMPGHAQAQAQMLGNVTNYVNSQRPDTSKKAPLDSNRQPSQVVQAAFNNLLGIAQQPLSVLPKVKAGTITPDDIKHLNAMYPAAWESMQKEISEAMAGHISKGGTVPYKTRVGLSIFTGQPIDSTFTPQAIQSAQPQVAPQSGAPKQGKKSSTKDLHKISQDALTPDQARQKAHTQTE